MLPKLYLATVLITSLASSFYCESSHAKSISEINREAGLLEQLFDGDMIIPNKNQHKRRTAFRGKANTWINNTVYYSFKDGYFNGKNESHVRHVIKMELEKITSKTCVSFLEDPQAHNRVKISDDKGCFSSHGMVGGVQSMSLAKMCAIFGGAVTHEFLHSLGFIHTHARPDRDNYVTINTTLIKEKRKSNFEEDPVKTLSVPYDYGSIMHYGADYFTEDDGISILPKDENYLYTIGSRIVAFTDILAVNKAYNCLDKCGEKVCYYGGYPNPNNCTECVCPLGFTGHDCNEWGSYAWAEANWKTFELNVHGIKHEDFNFLYYRIFVPAGKTVILKIMDISDYNCNYGCEHMGAELKIQSDLTLTGPRICCLNEKGNEFRSTNRVVPLFVYSRWGEFKLKVAYVFVD